MKRDFVNSNILISKAIKALVALLCLQRKITEQATHTNTHTLVYTRKEYP